MTTSLIRTAVVSAAAVTVLAAAIVSPAQAATGRDYSEHVRACQQDMGFTGTHNPGVMHQGFSSWDPTHAC